MSVRRVSVTPGRSSPFLRSWLSFTGSCARVRVRHEKDRRFSSCWRSPRVAFCSSRCAGGPGTRSGSGGLGAAAIASRTQAWARAGRMGAANAALLVLGVLVAGEGAFAVLALFKTPNLSPRRGSYLRASRDLFPRRDRGPRRFVQGRVEAWHRQCPPRRGGGPAPPSPSCLRDRGRRRRLGPRAARVERSRLQGFAAISAAVLSSRGRSDDPGTTLAPTTAYDAAFVARAR